MKLGVTHDVRIVRKAGASGLFGVCLECDWEGPERASEWDASGDIEAHVKEPESDA